MQATKPSTPKPVTVPVGLARKRKIPACKLSRDDLLQLYDQLNGKLQEEAGNRISQVVQDQIFVGTELESIKEALIDVYKITITINSTSGETIVGTSKAVIGSVPSDMELSSIYFDSQTAFQKHFNLLAKNRFWVLFDFSKPPALDISNPASGPTPNSSAFEVAGENDTWVRAVYDQLNSFFEPKRTNRNWFHKTGIYDVALWFAVIPVLILAILKISTMYEGYFSNIPTILNIALGVYFFLFATFLYRLVFAYTKWIFPLVELSDIGRGVSRVHRGFWWLLMIGVLGSVIASLP